eukprot:Skav227303  [mRNA]  locus=scaffold2645:254569:256005:- [translate_table: standard]
MECVVGAGRDPEVARTIAEFCSWTGYRKAEVDLSLGSIVPAKRDRWWCVLISPAWPPIHLRPLPGLQPLPTIQELLPFCPTWSDSDNAQLCLDRYESTRHESYGGVLNKVVNLHGQLPTALHGWANQLSGCPCGCRAGPLSEYRLAEKGLFAALVLLTGTYDTAYMGAIPKTRHLHPWELALLHGMHPNLDYSQGLRLGIAGLGQMASPVQSNWIVGRILFGIEEKFDMKATLPEVRLGNHFRSFFHEVAITQPGLVQHPSFQGFIARLWDTLNASIMASQVQPCLTGGVASVTDDQHENKNQEITRSGREDLKTIEQNQPPDRTGRPEVGVDKQPADETQGLIEEEEEEDGSVGHDTAMADMQSVAHHHPTTAPSIEHSFDHHHPAQAHTPSMTMQPTFADELRRVTFAQRPVAEATHPATQKESGEASEAEHTEASEATSTHPASVDSYQLESPKQSTEAHESMSPVEMGRAMIHH